MRCRVLQIRQGSAWFVHELDQVIIGPRAKLAFLNFFFEPGNLDWWHFRFWGAKSSLAPAGRSTAGSRKRSKRSFYGLTLSQLFEQAQLPAHSAVPGSPQGLKAAQFDFAVAAVLSAILVE